MVKGMQAANEENEANAFFKRRTIFKVLKLIQDEVKKVLLSHLVQDLHDKAGFAVIRAG